MEARPVRVVSFHTPDERYTKYAERLAASCRQQKITPVITPMRQHFDTWVEIVSLKPHVMLKTMEMLDTPVCWVDCDAFINAPLKLLDETQADFAIYAKDRHKRVWTPVGRKKPCELPRAWPDTRWFMTGTVFVNNTPAGIRFLTEWTARATQDRRGYQQLICQEAWCATTPETLWLPETYCSVHGRARPAVISHDLASCSRPKDDRAVRA